MVPTQTPVGVSAQPVVPGAGFESHIVPTATSGPAEVAHAPVPAPGYVVYTEYTTERLACSQPEKKTVPNTGPSANPPSAEQNYFNIPLMYNTGVGSSVLNDFQLECCELSTTHGIRENVNAQTKRTEHSIMIRFDASNPEHNKMLEVMNSIHTGSAQIVQAYKGIVKMPHFNATMPEATGFKTPVHRKMDEMSGKYVEGHAPTMFLKLFTRGKAPFVEQTMFTGLDGKPIPWSLLKNVEMKFIPLLHFKRIYVGGGKVSLQIEMVSAVVTYIKGRGTSTAQTSTITRLLGARPELQDAVAAQLAKITSDRQEQLLASSQPSGAGPTEANGNQPSFSGIAPNRAALGAPSTAQLPPPGSLPNIGNIPQIPAGSTPNIPGITNMAEFTGNAPMRPTMSFS